MIQTFITQLDYKILFRRIKDASLYFGAAMIALPISIFTSPIFAKNLSAYDFSALGYFSAIMSFFLPLINLSFYNYYMLDYFKREENESKNILRSLFSFLLIYNIFIITLGYLIIHLYLKSIDSQFNAFPLGLIVLLTGIVTLGRSFWLLRLRFERKSISYFLLSSIFLVSNVALGIVLVTQYHLGALGKLIPAMIIDLVICTIFILKFIKKIQIDFTIVKKAILFSFPIILSALLNLPLLTLDRILLERINNVNEFAYYSIAFGFAGYVYTFINAISMAIEPDVYKCVGERNKFKLVQLFMLLLFAVIVSCFTFISFSEPIVKFLTAGRYMGAVKYANLLVISQSLLALVYFLGSILTALKLTRFELLATIVIAITSIGTLLIFIFYYQYFGAIYSKLFTFILWFGILGLGLFFRNSKLMKPFYVR